MSKIDIAIVANSTGVSRGAMNLEKRKIKYVDFEATAKNGYLNALAVLVYTMEQLAEAGTEARIFTLGNVMKAVGRLQRTTNVLQAAGMDAEEILEAYAKGKTSGTMSEDEKELWGRFMDVYSEDVTLMSLYSDARLKEWEGQLKEAAEKGTRLDSTLRFKKLHVPFVRNTWARLPEVNEEAFEEVEGDEAIGF